MRRMLKRNTQNTSQLMRMQKPVPVSVKVLSVVILFRIAMLLTDDKIRISIENLTLPNVAAMNKAGDFFPAWQQAVNTSTTRQNDDNDHNNHDVSFSHWTNATNGLQLARIHGDPTHCRDVIFTADTRTPLLLHGMKEDAFVLGMWEALTHVIQLEPTMNRTCLAYLRIPQPFRDSDGQELHPVWARIPATALVMRFFPHAEYFLYMDTDATLALPNYAPTDMYHALAYDGYDRGPNATRQHKRRPPALIVNKPLLGWLCMKCEQYGLGHGCFNSGVLLWRRSKQALHILRTWWNARNDLGQANFFRNATKENGDAFIEHFHGWSFEPEKPDPGEKMSEQNRLMYIYATNPAMQEAIWPVPRQLSDSSNSSSCPGDLDVGHTPCLQNDRALEAQWNETEKSTCFVNHFADDKGLPVEVMKLMEASYAKRLPA